MDRSSYVYILASRRNGTLYKGVTAELSRRVWRHRAGQGTGFTAQYGVTRLVWYEVFADIRDAIAAEKRIKRWRRAWKLELIERANPQWLDLYETLNSRRSPRPSSRPQRSGEPGPRGRRTAEPPWVPDRPCRRSGMTRWFGRFADRQK